MATNPKIRYDIEAAVSGGGDVGALANQLEGLANTLEGDLKVQALASAQALRTLGEKQGAIENFRQLKTEVQDAAGRLREAQTAAQQLGQKIGTMEAPTRAQAGQLQRLRDAVRTSKDELQRKTVVLDQSRTALRSYGVGTDNLAQSERNVRGAIAASRTEVAAMAPAYSAAARAAVTSGTQQAQAARTTQTELKSLGDQLRTVQNIAVTALGGSFIGSLAKDVAATADEYNNLAARIKLVTGEGAAFETAFEGVQGIALRTNSELEGTATLFARIAQAGKEIGLTQEAALGLTETINQSIQLSGGSAESAKAAIIQLVQGLQSGVVRGEEFNSIMEQSPRLARALADGLGVTTGELRKLANQGALTTEVVLNAVQGQGAAIATEFEKLPPTVGRAIQNLSTSWTVYVGEVDKATGASQAAANAINFLGQNLSTIAGFLLDAGQAGAAFVALRLAQTFVGLGAAAQAAAVQVAASNAAIAATGTAAAGAVAGVGRFAAILSTLRTFTLLGIVTNFQDIGTWIGEAAAKLAGYKDRTDELAAAEKAAAQISRENAQFQAATAQAMQQAAEAARGLTPEAKALTLEFEKLRTGGKGVADSLDAIAKNANLSDTAGIEAFSIAMRDLGVQGQASGDQIREAFARALKGEDLAAFEVRARLALAGARDEAELLATVLDASLREAINRSGADFAAISGGMGQAARSAINDTELIINNLDRLAEQGVDTAAALTASLGKGISTADSAAAIEALRQQVELVRKVLGDKVADGFLNDIEERAKRVVSGLGAVADAFKTLGIVSREDLARTATEFKAAYDTVLKSGQATAEGLQAAFKKYAEAAIAANGGIATEVLKSEAAMRGLELVTDAAGKTIVRAMGEGAQATERFRAGVQQSVQEVQGLMGWLDRLEQRNAQVKSNLVSDKDGFTQDKSGNRLAAGGELTTLTGISKFLQEAGLDAAQAKRLALEFSDGKGNIPYFSNAGQIKYGGRASTMSEALLKAAEQTTFGTGAGGAAGIGRTVNVNLQVGGKTQTVTTNEEGAQALLSTLQLASLSSRG